MSATCSSSGPKARSTPPFRHTELPSCSHAQTAGTTVLRLADADLLPFDFAGTSNAVAKYVKEVQALAKERREAAEERNRRVDEGLFEAVANPKHPSVAPAKETPVPAFDFSPLEKASSSLADAAKDFEAARAGAEKLRGSSLARVNEMLRRAERALTREEGLPRRPWFKHYVYAPGFYTGYDVKTLPAVREAIEEKQYADVDANVKRTAEAIENLAALVREATAALR